MNPPLMNRLHRPQSQDASRFHSVPNRTERREGHAIWLIHRGRHFAGHIDRLTVGTVLVRTSAALPYGTSVSLELSGDTIGALAVPGQVRFKTETGYGIQLGALDAWSVWALHRLMGPANRPRPRLKGGRWGLDGLTCRALAQHCRDRPANRRPGAAGEAVRVLLRNTEIDGTAERLDTRGVFVRTERPLPLGTRVAIRVSSGTWAGELELPAVVRWVTADGMGLHHGPLRARELWALHNRPQHANHLATQPS